MKTARRLVKAFIVISLVVSVGYPVVGQTSELTLDASVTDAAPGSAVTVTFNVANNGDADTAAIVNVTNRPEWERVNRTNDDGTWRDDEKWLFQTIPAGDSVSPELTLAVPSDAAGEYQVTAIVTNGEATSDVETTFVVEEQSSPGGVGETSGFPLSSSLLLIGSGILIGAVVLMLIVRHRN